MVAENVGRYAWYWPVALRLAVVVGLAAGAYDVFKAWQAGESRKFFEHRYYAGYNCAARFSDELITQHANAAGNTNVALPPFLCGDGAPFWVSLREVQEVRGGTSPPWTRIDTFNPLLHGATALAASLATLLGASMLAGVWWVGRWILRPMRRGQ